MNHVASLQRKTHHFGRFSPVCQDLWTPSRRKPARAAFLAPAALAAALALWASPEAGAGPDGETRGDAPDTYPPTILHVPVTHGTLGAPLPIAAEVLDRTGVGQCTVFYRKKGKAVYEAAPMDKTETGSYQAVLQIGGETAETAEYYLAAVDMAGNPPAFYGSEAEPFVIHFDPAGPSEHSHVATAGLVSLGAWLAVMALVLRYWTSRRKRKEIDLLFWRFKLNPLLNLPPVELHFALLELARRPIHHPLQGSRTYTQGALLHKLATVRRSDLKVFRSMEKVGTSVPGLKPVVAVKPPPARRRRKVEGPSGRLVAPRGIDRRRQSPDDQAARDGGSFNTVWPEDDIRADDFPWNDALDGPDDRPGASA